MDDGEDGNGRECRPRDAAQDGSRTRGIAGAGEPPREPCDVQRRQQVQTICLIFGTNRQRRGDGVPVEITRPVASDNVRVEIEREREPEKIRHVEVRHLRVETEGNRECGNERRKGAGTGSIHFLPGEIHHDQRHRRHQNRRQTRENEQPHVGRRVRNRRLHEPEFHGAQDRSEQPGQEVVVTRWIWRLPAVPESLADSFDDVAGGHFVRRPGEPSPCRKSPPAANGVREKRDADHAGEHIARAVVSLNLFCQPHDGRQEEDGDRQGRPNRRQDRHAVHDDRAQLPHEDEGR